MGRFHRQTLFLLSIQFSFTKSKMTNVFPVLKLQISPVCSVKFRDLESGTFRDVSLRYPSDLYRCRGGGRGRRKSVPGRVEILTSRMRSRERRRRSLSWRASLERAWRCHAPTLHIIPFRSLTETHYHEPSVSVPQRRSTCLEGRSKTTGLRTPLPPSLRPRTTTGPRPLSRSVFIITIISHFRFVNLAR